MVESKRIKKNRMMRFVAKVSFCCQHVYMDKLTAENSAKQIAQDLNGPVGPVPLERVIVKHMGFIKELKKSGATWPQIAHLLDRVGARKKDGKAISPGQLRAIFSRTQSKKNPHIIKDCQISSKDRNPITNLNTYGMKKNSKKSHSKKIMDNSIRAKMNRARKVRQRDN